MFDHNARAKVIWAHTGFSVPAARVRELLEKYPALMCELSYRDGITQRWYEYGTVMKQYRDWLGQLPEDQARRIAYGNAERLFGGKIGE